MLGASRADSHRSILGEKDAWGACRSIPPELPEGEDLCLPSVSTKSLLESINTNSNPALGDHTF